MKKNSYYTRDLYESAFLYASRQKLLELEKEDNYFWFVFEDKPACEKLSAVYISGEAEINARTYSDSIRLLKDRLFVQKKRF